MPPRGACKKMVNAAGAVQGPAFTLLFSTSNDRSNPQGLDGSTVNGDIHVFTDPDEGVDDVDFFLDGVFERTEKNGPFDFRGGSSSTANKWPTDDESDGEHTILAELLMDDGSTQQVSATFTIQNNPVTPPPPPPSGTIPIDIDIHCDVDVATLEKDCIIVDVQ